MNMATGRSADVSYVLSVSRCFVCMACCCLFSSFGTSILVFLCRFIRFFYVLASGLVYNTSYGATYFLTVGVHLRTALVVLLGVRSRASLLSIASGAAGVTIVQ